MRDVPKLVDKAVFSYGRKRRGEVDAWVEKVVHMPVTSEGSSGKAVKVASGLRCHLGEDLVCSFTGSISSRVNYFVASAVACLDETGHEVLRADWKAPGDAKRDAVRDLPVETEFIKKCWEKNGVRLKLDLVGSRCRVRFPRQVRCAGEYNTCRQTCKDRTPCLAKCDHNRRDCLKVCGKR